MDSFVGFLIIVFGVLAVGIFWGIYTCFDHWSPRDASSLNANAKVIDFSQKRFNKYKFKSTVTFDDGFEYVSFKTKSSPSGLNRTTIYTTQEMNMDIVEKAIQKHTQILARR